MKKILLLVFIFTVMKIAVAEEIGVISLATKDVVILDSKGNQRTAKTGDNFNQNDTIITPKGGKTQLLFKDQMTINLSQGSELKVDEFVFSNDNQQDNKLTTSIKKGAFKFISGKISDQNPEAMKVKTPKTQIAIRGTSVIGDIKEDSENIVLLDGIIEVAPIDNPALSQIINQSGLAVVVDVASGSISPPAPIDTKSLNTIFQEVSLTTSESQSSTSDSAESQQLVSSISKSLLEEEDSELNAAFGEKAQSVKTAVVKAADTVIAAKEAASPSSSGQEVSLTVSEIFTTLASQNAEVAKAIFTDEGESLTNANNVVVSASVVAAIVQGYSMPTGALFGNFTDGRSGTIVHEFNDITLAANTGTGSGSGTAKVTIDIDNKTFEAESSGSGTIGAYGAFTWNQIGYGTTWGDGDNIKDGVLPFDILTDTITDLDFIFADLIALGGARASLQMNYLADDYPTGDKDFAYMALEIYTKDGSGNIDNSIDGIQQITPSR
jgi:hypothetical protein